MRLRRRVVQAGLVVVGLSLLAAPAAAQSVNRAAIDDLNEQLLYVALPLTLFVELTLVYVIYRFRNNADPKPTVDDPALEVTWTAATGAILVFVGVSAFVVMANPYITPAAAEASADGDAFADDTEIDVLAYQWGWEFSYTDVNVTTEERLVIPADENVTFRLQTTDVIHAIYIPKLGVKQDIFPGRTMTARTRATEPGEYRLYCAEMCGAGHSRMDATVVVKNQSAYDTWVENQTATAG
ncbi:cytochrome c oxidase subunit 2 [Haloarcula vallismortis]|uniref:cytochrome-c oxidase n=2 Tax=Haloarcula vallismortis TaxID=28442 RepID=M0J2J0_HALVA|nr:cytochrome c oxidase subunit II [Haloarcula vallismortis]EMA01950.1 cytochrome c oxidase subunit II [Haloarcula vallismortis ATCC 29715]SDW50099.1 cytochrome c oxidase subunit 2 [Haloarcula vallismortis]